MDPITCKDTGEVVFTYDNYLRTKHWRKIRERFKKSKFAQVCYLCGSGKNLNLHHKSYKRIGCEKLNDLIWLCPNCHSHTHNELNKRRSNKVNLWNISRKIRRKQVREETKQTKRAKKCQKILNRWNAE